VTTTGTVAQRFAAILTRAGLPSERRRDQQRSGACTTFLEDTHGGRRFFRRRRYVAPGVNLQTLFGLFAVSSMLVCYALEKRSVWFILGFAVACALGSAYGFLQGAWPFGIVEGIWSLVALQRWWRAVRRRGDEPA
jgi:hypothetical protein